MHFYQNVIQVHLDQELTKKYVANFHSEACPCPEDQERPNFVTKLLQMNGIKLVQLDKHTAYISKGEVFTWEELLEPIMTIFLYEFALNSGITFVEPHLEFTPNPLSGTHDKKIKTINLPNPFKLTVRERKDGKDKPKQ